MKRIISMLCCLFLLCTFVSCTKQTSTKDGTDKTEPGDREPSALSLELVRDGTSRYEIVYPQICRKEDAAAVMNFSKAFQDATGILLPQKDDFLKNGEIHEGDTCKILIGKTNYAESQKVYKDLMYQDYKIEIQGTNLVIAAYTAGGYDAALGWLKQNAFSGMQAGRLTVGETSGSLVTGYPISSWTIGGVNLNQYSIIYAKEEYKESLTALRDRIAVQTGCVLDVVRDTDRNPTPYEILFGDTNRKESVEVPTPSALHYKVQAVDGKLVVKAGGEHSFLKLMDEFLTIVAEDVAKVVMNDTYVTGSNFYDDPHSIARAKGTDLRLMTANLQAQIKGYNEGVPEDFTFERRLEIFLAAVDFYKPDVIGLQECCMTWHKGIKTYAEMNQWQLLEFTNPNLTSEYVLSTIMFRKDKFELVDSGMTYYSKYNNGRCRCITWAVLKDKNTNQEFCFVSTHWDGGDKSENTAVQVTELATFVNEMAKKYPVFTTGDFNRNEYTEEFKTFLRLCGSVDSMYAAEKRLNIAGSWHDWGKGTPSAGSCDHITATSVHAKVLQFETLMYNEQIYASDHAWLFADIQFK